MFLQAGVVNALAQLSTHLHPDMSNGSGGRRGSYRRRRSRSRSPSVLAIQAQRSTASSAPPQQDTPKTAISAATTTGTDQQSNVTSNVGDSERMGVQTNEFNEPLTPSKQEVFAETVSGMVDRNKYDSRRRRCKFTSFQFDCQESVD